jgi:hypothetical protein
MPPKLNRLAMILLGVVVLLILAGVLWDHLVPQ